MGVCCMQYAKADVEDAMGVGDKRNGIDPDWTTADRVIAKQVSRGKSHKLSFGLKFSNTHCTHT